LPFYFDGCSEQETRVGFPALPPLNIEQATPVNDFIAPSLAKTALPVRCIEYAGRRCGKTSGRYETFL